MKKVLALVLSLVLMLGGSAAALAETAQSIPPLSQISSNPNSATFTWRSDVSTQDVEEGDFLYSNKHFKAELYFRFNFSNYRNQCQGGCYSRLYVCAALE